MHSCYLWKLTIFIKLVIQAQDVLTSQVEVHLRYINLSIEFHYHIICIVEVIEGFLYKNFKLNFEGFGRFRVRSIPI